MKNLPICFLIGFFLFFSGCKKEKTQETKVEKEKIEESKKESEEETHKREISPFEALKSMGKIAKEIKNAVEEVEKLPEIKDVVDWRNLIQVLPKSGDMGLNYENEPKGSKSSFDKFKASQAEVSMSDKEKTVSVKIVDFAYNLKHPLFLAWNVARNYEEDSSEGYRKKETILDYPAIIKSDYKSKKTSLEIMVNKRFLITFDCVGNIQDADSFLKKFATFINYKQLDKFEKETLK